MISTIPADLDKKNGLYTVTETSRMMKVARGTVYNYIRKGILVEKRKKKTFERVITGISIYNAIASVY